MSVVIRFIPTLAGNTPVKPFRDLIIPVHPHARGEHIFLKKLNLLQSGSSPRSRGTPTIFVCRIHVMRFIPTLAGNTSSDRRKATNLTVHPHARGEHSSRRHFPQLAHGSSPRSRGTHHRGTIGKPRYRFIPTLAGNTRPSIDNRKSTAVHPHARGEHFCRRFQDNSLFGSSPRSRGTPRVIMPELSTVRFIPTLAGNTHDEGHPVKPHAVHPHARGEHSMEIPGARPQNGSSPRSRGTPLEYRQCAGAVRFIPTLAGNTHLQSLLSIYRTVHPHARGEHFRLLLFIYE